MPFPDKDPLYDEAALFLESHMKAGETVVALSEFRDRFPQNAVLDLMTTKKPGGFQWAVIHRAAVHRVAPDLLARIARCCRPVYENGLFLIFSDRPDLAVLDEPSFAVKDFRRKVRAIGLASRLLDAELFLEAGKTSACISHPTHLAMLAIVDDIDSGADLPPYDVADRPPHSRFQCGGVVLSPEFLDVERLHEIGRAR